VKKVWISLSAVTAMAGLVLAGADAESLSGQLMAGTVGIIMFTGGLFCLWLLNES
jgi:hypothetical protein